MRDSAANALRRLAAPARDLAARANALVVLPVFGLLLLAMLWFGIFYHLHEEKEAALQQAVSSAEALAKTYGERTFRILRLLDQSSQFLKFESERHGANASAALLDALQRRGMLPTDITLMISVTDAEGKPLASNQPFAIGNVADRDYFRVHAARDSGALYISQPVVGRQSGKRVIVFSRRLNHADGSFAGVVLLSVDQEYLSAPYDAAELGQNGLLALVGADGAFRSRRVGDQQHAERQGDFSRWAGSAGAPRGAHPAVADPLDGVPRIYAKRELHPFPLVAVVGLAEEEVLTKYREGRTDYFVMALAGSFGIAGFIALLLLQTDRLRTSERAAKDAHAVLSAAAERSLSGFFILRSVRGPEREIVDFTVADINDSGARFLGIARDGAAGKSFGELRPELRHEGLFRKCAQVTDGGVSIDEEFETAAGGLPPRWLHQQIVPIGDGVAVTVRDISERKHAEIETRDNRAFLQSLIDYLPVLIYARSFRPENRGCTIVWNNAAEAVTGYPASQVIGRTNHDAFLPQLAEQFEKLDREMLADPQVADVPELLFRRFDGGLRCLRLISVPLFDDQNQVQYILGIGEDITARHEAKLALAKSEQRLRTIADTLPAQVAYLDADQRFRFANLACERAFGVSRDYIRDLTLHEFLGDTEYRSVEPYVKRVLSGETVTFEHEESNGGAYRCNESTYIPQFAEDGCEVIGFHVMTQDITPKKLEERRLLQLAQIDSLTGLANRAGFEQKLADAMARSKAAQTLMAVMYLDIDFFKAVNDSHGHPAGDLLLKAFAARLTRTLRAIDTVARVGGDEFTVIMEGLARSEDAEAVAGKIVQAMRAPFTLDELALSVSTSIGIAFYQGEELEPAELIRQADELLYEAKAAGRDKFCAARRRDRSDQTEYQQE